MRVRKMNAKKLLSLMLAVSMLVCSNATMVFAAEMLPKSPLSSAELTTVEDFLANAIELSENFDNFQADYGTELILN